jgi:excinuclease ABC subunit C
MVALSDWNSFPRAPGVYLMADGRGNVLYVGKAKDLRARLHNYTVPGGDGRPQIPHLVREVASVRCIVTATEKEALLLENTLIKKHRPRFNVFLRDDKEYLLLRIGRNEKFPRPELVRRTAKDGAAYFGPFSSARGAREMLRLLFRLFPLCSCTPRTFASRTRPCLNYQMGRCSGACGGMIGREDYLVHVDNAVRFLKGKYRDLLRRWKTHMTALAADRRFEEAAAMRDRIALIERTLLKQRVVRTGVGDLDAVGWYREEKEATAAVLHVRGGRLSDAHTYHFRAEGDRGELLSSFLAQHYGEGALVPGEILLPFDVPSREALEGVLRDRAESAVSLRAPQKGERARLLDLATRNAEEAHRMRKEKEAAYERVAARLQALCLLPAPPVRIEGFDISTTLGEEPVGSMVVFAGGKPAKKWYRKFAVRGIPGQDDFAMMEQVVRRRFGHDEDFGGKPDLVLVDGGKGQLFRARAAMEAAGAGNIPALALAKERVRGGETKAFERIYLPGRMNPLILSPDDPALHLLMRVRDEAHRFAVSFHRARRTKRALGNRTGRS